MPRNKASAQLNTFHATLPFLSIRKSKLTA